MMKTQTHLMLDLETLGQSSTAVVLSVGAVAFTKDNVIEEKEWFLDVEQQLSQGRKVDYSTIKWWMTQSEKARFEAFNPAFKHFLSAFSAEFAQFFTKNCGESGLIWGNGASFDIPIIESLITKQHVPIPWKFWFHRCYRTVKTMHKIEDGHTFQGEKHGALLDARFQAKCLQDFFRKHPELEK